MLTVTLTMTVEMVVGGDDSGNCSSVEGGLSQDDNADGRGDLGRDDWKGERAMAPIHLKGFVSLRH